MLPNKTKNAIKNLFSISALFGLFYQKRAKIDQKLRKFAKSNCLIKFSEIWYVNASQQKKIQQKNYVLILAFFWPYSAKKKAKIDKK